MKRYQYAFLLIAFVMLFSACSSRDATGGAATSHNAMSSSQQAEAASDVYYDGAAGAVMPAATYGKDSTWNSGTASTYEMPYDGDASLEGESYAAIYETGFASPYDKPLSTFSADVDTAAYTNIRRRIENRQTVTQDMVRIEEMINYFHYDYPSPMGESPIAITTELSDCPWNPEHKLVLIGLKAEEIREEQAPAANLVFLIDVSGSMDMENKLPLVKRAFGLLTEELTENDRVSIVTYASSDEIVLKGAPGNEKASIRRAIEDLTAGGSTHASSGISTAYEIARSLYIEGGTNRVILATDGDFNVGVTSERDLQRMIERERDGGVYLTVLGFGMGNYKDSKVETLAKHGNGNYAYVDNLQAARKTLVDELGATLHTVAKDVKLQVEFNPATVREYRLIGYEHRMLRDEDFLDDTKDAGDIGAGHTVTALYEIVPEGASTSAAALKYQPEARAATAPASGDVNGEWLTVKIRYKDPDSSTSKEISAVVGESAYTAAPSANLKLAGAVAEFGLLLRGSEYRGSASVSNVLETLQPLSMMDDYGYVRDLKSVVEGYQNTK